jgi:hypothetical protein
MNLKNKFFIAFGLILVIVAVYVNSYGVHEVTKGISAAFPTKQEKIFQEGYQNMIFEIKNSFSEIFLEDKGFDIKNLEFNNEYDIDIFIEKNNLTKEYRKYMWDQNLKYEINQISNVYKSLWYHYSTTKSILKTISLIIFIQGLGLIAFGIVCHFESNKLKKIES